MREVLLILVCLLKFTLWEVDVDHLWLDLGIGPKRFDSLVTWTTGAIH